MESSETETEQPPQLVLNQQDVPVAELEDLGIGEELKDNLNELRDEDLSIYEDEADGTDISDLDLKKPDQTDGNSHEDTDIRAVDENSVHVSIVEQSKETEVETEAETLGVVSRADINDDVSSLQTASAALQKNLSVSIQPAYMYMEKEKGGGGRMSEMSIESRLV